MRGDAAMRNLVGKVVYITDRESMYFNEWGTVISQDEDGFYHIAIANGRDSLPVFDRTQFKVRRNSNERRTSW